MDYSLYLVVERSNGALRQPTRNEYLSSDGTELFHVSIIDYLQEWNLDKKVERCLKSFKPNTNVEGISAVEPERYRRRFIDAMQTQVFKLDNMQLTSEEREINADFIKTVQ